MKNKMKIISVLAAVFCLLFMVTSPVSADYSLLLNDYYVDGSVGTSGDGSFGNPWKTIKEAMVALVSESDATTVHVAAGTYDTALGEVFPLAMRNYVSLVSDSGPANTIIDANATSQVFIIVGLSNAQTIDGFTIQNGDGIYGGGFYIESSSSTIIRNCVIRNNYARGVSNGNAGGGGIFAYNTPVLIDNCEIIDNIAQHYYGGDGGGIHVYACDITINDSLISGNIASGRGRGGGVFSQQSSTLNMNRTTVTNNTVTSFNSYGGGVNTGSSSSLIMNDCTITGNAAKLGGGIHGNRSSVTLTNSTISDNKSRVVGGISVTIEHGGGIYLDRLTFGSQSNAEANISGCTIENNDADGPSYIGGSGGAIYAYSSPLTLTNSLLTGNNTTDKGGAILCEMNSPSTIMNCTISGNTAGSQGGGIYADGNGSSGVITNTILWGDLPDEIVQIGTPLTLDHSNIQIPWTGAGVNFCADPMFFDSTNGDYYITSGSPCRNAGTDLGAPFVDIDGGIRPCGDDVSYDPLPLDGIYVDIGAYEFVPPPYVNQAPVAIIEVEVDSINIADPEQLTITIAASAFDPDGEADSSATLQYRWIDGNNVTLVDWTTVYPVDSSSVDVSLLVDAPLLSLLGEGIHDLYLEVDDNFIVTYDQMVLTVENIPLNELPIADILADTGIQIETSQHSITEISALVSDADGDTLQYRWVEKIDLIDVEPPLVDWTLVYPSSPVDVTLAFAGLDPFSTGDHYLYLEVSDDTSITPPPVELIISESVILTVQNSAPVVTVSGEGAYDGDDVIELGGVVEDFDGDLVSYRWYNVADPTVNLFEGTVQTNPGEVPEPLTPLGAVDLPDLYFFAADLPIGLHYVVCEVSDGIADPVSSDPQTLEIVDDERPKLKPKASPKKLPSDGQMHTVVIDTRASDNSGTVYVEVASVEIKDKHKKHCRKHNHHCHGHDKHGEHPTNDHKCHDDHPDDVDYELVSIDNATGLITIRLRAENSGKGHGRKYKIYITATDPTGNSRTKKVTIKSSHKKKKKKHHHDD